jgi:hypothetical protein
VWVRESGGGCRRTHPSCAAPAQCAKRFGH